MATNVEVADSISPENKLGVCSNRNGNTEKVPEALLKRHKERQAKLDKMREKRENESVKQESADFFYKTFTAEKASIEERLATANNVEKSGLIDFFDEITDSVNKLQKYVTDTSTFLPSYDVRNAQENVTKLLAAINEKRDELLPKKKFTFKARKGGTGKTKNTAKQQIIKSDIDMIDSTNGNGTFTGNACGFSNRSSETLCLPSDEIHMKDVSLSNLNSCTVKLTGSPSAVHINNLSNCKVFCGPIPGSVFANMCFDCVLVMACQQLRVHNTTDTKFYLHVTSRAIIEDTSKVLFAPYNWSYDGLQRDYQQSGLDQTKNSWDDIDDFNWLAHDKRSPNWGQIPESDRVTSWDD